MSNKSQSEPTSSTELTEEKGQQKPSQNSEDGEPTKDLSWILVDDLRLVPDALLKRADLNILHFRAVAMTMLKNPCMSALYGLNEQKIIVEVVLVRFDLFDQMVHLSALPGCKLYLENIKGIQHPLEAKFGKCDVVTDYYTLLKVED